MNERIKQLAVQAGMRTVCYEQDEDTYFTQTLDVEKFAELIVRECIKQARSEEDRFYGIGASDLALTMEHFQELLKTHFGVEEMITANQALKLCQDSSVDEFLKLTVESEVIKAANSGKRQVIIHLGTIAYYENVHNRLSTWHLAVIERLKALGYIAEAKKYGDSYVPRGLADDQGNGPMYTNYGIHIGW